MCDEEEGRKRDKRTKTMGKVSTVHRGDQLYLKSAETQPHHSKNT